MIKGMVLTQKKKGNTKDKYHDKYIPYLSRFVGKNPREGYPAQERYTPPFYAKISAAAGAKGGVSAVSIPSGGAGTTSRDLKSIYNKQIYLLYYNFCQHSNMNSSNTNNSGQ